MYELKCLHGYIENIALLETCVGYAQEVSDFLEFEEMHFLCTLWSGGR